MVASVALAGCRADVGVDVVVAEDGSGTVTVTVEVDQAVVDQVNELELQVRTDDLVAAGWQVAEPVDGPDGGLVLQATKEVPSAGQFGPVLAEIHPLLFPSAELDMRRSFASTRYLWTSTLDRTVSFEAFGDPEVADLLGGFLFGVPLDVLAGRAGGPLDEAVTVSFSLSMPDGTTTPVDAATLGAAEADQVSASALVVDAQARSERERADYLRQYFALMAAAVGAWLVVVAGVVWFLLRRRHRR